MKIYFEVDGCSRRLAELASLRKYLELNNHSFVRKPGPAEFIVVATCAFKKQEEERSVVRIKDLMRYNTRLLVYGCLPSIAPARFRQFNGVENLGPKNIEQIDSLFPDHRVKFSEVRDINIIPAEFCSNSIPSAVKKLKSDFEISGRFFRRARTYTEKKLKTAFKPEKKFYLFVCKGCMGKCTYCAIKRAIGPLGSFWYDSINRQFLSGLRSGYTDYVILGDDVGAYGLDKKSSLPQLLSDLTLEMDRYLQRYGETEHSDKLGFHIEEIHPKWIIRYRNELLGLAEAKRIKNILCPVQSGSDRILQLMCREHESKEIADVLGEFRRAAPAMKLSTQLIVGFPTETEDDFQDSLNLVNECGFDSVSLFPYDCKENTPAANMEPKVTDAIIDARVKQGLKFFKKHKIPAQLSCQLH